MPRCPLFHDEDPPCIARCSVAGDLDAGDASKVRPMLSACISSLTSLGELTVDEALTALERMALVARGKVRPDRATCARMAEFSEGAGEAVAGIAHPRLWELHVRAGDILLACGSEAPAEAEYERALGLNPSSPEAWNNLGLAKKRRGDLSGARDAYGKAVEIAPDYPQGWFNLAMLHFDNGEDGEAKDAFAKAARLDVYNVVALNNIGVILRREGRSEEALKFFNKALDVDREYAKAWHNKGIALAELGRDEQAVKCLVHALELEPGLREAEAGLRKLGYEPPKAP